MFALSLVFAFFAPFFSRVFWKSFDEISNLEDRALRNLPEVVNEVLATLTLTGILALLLYNYVEFSVEATAGTAISVGAVFLRLGHNTFDCRLISRMIRWLQWSAASLKAKYIR